MSCLEIAETRPSNARSGLYWLTVDGTVFQAYCVISSPDLPTVGWMQVVNITPSQGCPDELEAFTAGEVLVCRKIAVVGCSSVNFPTHGISYSKVCGRVHGYQFGTTDAFVRYEHCPDCTIDQPFVDGVTITHGTAPRQHIWSLATTNFPGHCPCSDSPTHSYIPTDIVGQDYSCEVESTGTYLPADRLWDGSDCEVGTEQCCEGPWFCADLPQPTTDDIEFRVCADQPRDDEDVYIDHIEIYVQ